MSQQLRTRDEIAAYFEDVTRTRDLGRGTAFPTASDGITLAAGDRFFRTDLLLDCVYDGTRWLTRDTFEVHFALFQAISTTQEDYARLWTLPGDLYPAYITRFDVLVNTGATNNGSNYWTIRLRAAGTTTLGSVTTAALAASTNDQRLGLTSFTQPTGNQPYVNLRFEKTASPTNIDAHAVARYRYVLV